MPPIQPKAQQFDFYKYLRMIWRRKWLLILPLAVCVPISIIAAYNLPTEYESTAIIELQEGRPSVEATPYHVNVAMELATVKTRMLSWNMIREVILSRKVDFGKEVDPDDRRQVERIHYEIARHLRLAALGPRHMAVSHRSISAEKNASLVNELVKKFVGEERAQAQESAKTDLKFYREKLAGAQARLAEVDNQIREFMQANPWLRDAVSDLHGDYKDAEERERELNATIGELEAEVAKRKKDLAKEKPEITEKRTVLPLPEIAEARKAYQEAKATFVRVQEAYTPAHRLYQRWKGELDKAEARLKQIDKEGEAEEKEIEETKPNPVYAHLEGQVKAYEKELEKLNQRKLAANKKVNELYVLYRRAPELMAQKRGLDEQRGIHASTVDEYAKSMRAAERELQRLMTEAYSSRFKVVEYARIESRPVRDTKVKIIALGILLGLLTGAGLVGLLEYLDQTFKTIDDAREYLNLPALGVIPAIFTPRDHRRRLWFRLLSVSAAVFVVGIAIAIYLVVPATREYLTSAWVAFKELMESW